MAQAKTVPPAVIYAADDPGLSNDVCGRSAINHVLVFTDDFFIAVISFRAGALCRYSDVCIYDNECFTRTNYVLFAYTWEYWCVANTAEWDYEQLNASLFVPLYTCRH